MITELQGIITVCQIMKDTRYKLHVKYGTTEM